MSKDESVKKFLIWTNPMVIPIWMRVLGSILLNNLFSGIYKDTKKVLKGLDF